MVPLLVPALHRRADRGDLRDHPGRPGDRRALDGPAPDRGLDHRRAAALVAGARGLARFQEALAEGRMPHREVLDGVLIIVGGAFLLTPGFITDIFGLVLLLPPTRAVVRRGAGAPAAQPASRALALAWSSAPGRRGPDRRALPRSRPPRPSARASCRPDDRPRATSGRRTGAGDFEDAVLVEFCGSRARRLRPGAARARPEAASSSLGLLFADGDAGRQQAERDRGAESRAGMAPPPEVPARDRASRFSAGPPLSRPARASSKSRRRRSPSRSSSPIPRPRPSPARPA